MLDKVYIPSISDLNNLPVVKDTEKFEWISQKEELNMADES